MGRLAIGEVAIATIASLIVQARLATQQFTAGVDRMVSDLNRVTDQAQRVDKDLRGINFAADRFTRTGTALTVGLTAPLVAAGVAASKFAIDFESSMAQVRRTTDATASELATIGTELRKLSEQPGRPSTNALAAIASSAGQLGISVGNLVEFTDIVAQLGATTTLSLDEAGTSLARFANITGTIPDDLDRVASAIVRLGKSGAGTETELVNMALRIAGAGKQIGLSQGDILAFANALSSVGIEAEAGGSAISRVMVTVAQAVASGGAALDDFARLTGRTAEQFRVAFRDDAASAIVDIIEGLNRVAESGGNVFAVLKRLDIDDLRVRDALLRAAGAGELFRKQLEIGNRAFQENTALSQAFGAISQTTAAQLSGLANAARNVAAELGAALLPALNAVLGLLKSAVGPLRTIVAGFAALPDPVRAAAVALAVLVASIGPLLLLAGQLAQAFVFLKTATVLAGVSLSALAGIVATGGVLLAGLGLVAAGLLGIAAAATATGRQVAALQIAFAGLSREQLRQRGIELESNLIAARQRERELRQQAARDPIGSMLRTAASALGRTPREIDVVRTNIKSIQTELNVLSVAFGQAGVAERRFAAESERIAAEVNAAFQNIDFGPDDEAIKAGVKQLDAAVSASLARLSFSNQTTAQGNDTLRAAAILHRQIADRIEAQGGPLRANVALLEQSQQLIEAIGQRLGTVQVSELEVFFPDQTDRFLLAVQEFERAKGELNLAVAADDRQAIQTATAQLNALYARIAQARAVFADIISASNLSDQTKQRVLAELEKILADAGVEADQLNRHLNGTRSALNKITVGARGLLQTGNALNFIGEQARKALDGMLGLADSLASIGDSVKGGLGGLFKGGKILDPTAFASGIAGAIGGAVSLFAGIFDDSARVREQVDAQQRNTEALESLRARIDGLLQSVSGTARAGEAAAALAQSNLVRGLLKQQAVLPGVRPDISAINQFLKDFNLTFGQLVVAAQDLGITLLDSSSRLIPGALEALAAALGATARDITRIGQDLESQRSLNELIGDVFDVENTPQEQIQRQLDLINRFAGDQIKILFAGLHPTTEAGRAEIERVLRELILAIQAGVLPIEAFGDLSAEDALAIIRAMEGGLDALTEATLEATQAMIGVPQGFSLALREWQAQLPTVDTPLVPPLPTPPLIPVNPPFIPPAPPHGRGPEVLPANITLVIDTRGRTKREVAEDILDGLQEIAQGQFGDSSRWNEVQ